MFLINDPGLRLDMYHHHAAELHRSAEAHRLAARVRADASRGLRLRWPGHGRTMRPVRTPVAP
ncbi:hypothetical protein [Krasilnikovia sp. M28-CT-15]|uniref:hypothetical protein n=1 Tax=Krasilnikovia sp. M28-CT-15 TaxID=3373540 RepID=UPI003875B497